MAECSVRSHLLGLQPRLEAAGEILRTEVCRTQAGVIRGKEDLPLQCRLRRTTVRPVQHEANEVNIRQPSAERVGYASYSSANGRPVPRVSLRSVYLTKLKPLHLHSLTIYRGST